MTSTPEEILDALRRISERADEKKSACDPCLAALRIETFDDLDALVGALEDAAWLSELDGGPADAALAEVCARMWQFLQADRLRRGLEQDTVASIAQLYRRLNPQCAARPQLLRTLAAAGDGDSLAAFTDLLSTDPPRGDGDPALPFLPLFQQPEYAVDALFPRLLALLDQPAYAAVVLDLANFLTRQGRVDEHPAAERVTQLATLLGALVQRLEQIGERPKDFASSPQELTRLVGEGVALVVPLCDALAQIGDDRVTGKLHQALGLPHRRLRTEAAAALARLGDKAGLEALAGMASEPIVRSRVLAYLSELGQLERAAEEHRSPQARAEGDVTAWLAEPSHFGAAPTSLELIDHSRLYWPGHSAQVDCYLFRFEYRLGERSHSGIALAGPVTHVVNADLQDLPPADIYAVYAGWHAEHEDIREKSADELTPEEAAAWRAVREQLESAGYESLELVKAAQFFEQVHWVATTRHGGRPGVVIVSGQDAHWHPTAATRRPLGPTEKYYLHKGREILRTFNPS